MLQACYAHVLRGTRDERGGFTKGRPRQGPVGQVKSRKLKYFGHTTRH